MKQAVGDETDVQRLFVPYCCIAHPEQLNLALLNTLSPQRTEQDTRPHLQHDSRLSLSHRSAPYQQASLCACERYPAIREYVRGQVRRRVLPFDVW